MPSLEHRISLVDQLLAEQQDVSTAASKFSSWHDEQGHDEPLQARYYKNLIPLSRPLQGRQYAFEVNLDQCTGCKACVAACHSLNGLDENESWRDIGALAGCRDEPYLQTVTTACHHCLDPACANGCPVLAYEKDPETGIVRHLDDQCIGCSYCILKCPYDVPKFNAKKGIVRKCDMCQQRLAVGEAPACVQSCPSGAIAIRIVETSTVTTNTSQPDAKLLPGSFPSAYTRPTTQYLSRRDIPLEVSPQHEGTLSLEEAHWPLAWMLILTQMAAGLVLAATLVTTVPGIRLALGLAGTGVLALGLAASVLHLGQPFRAWRAFLGWRKSWLSREIIAFGGFFKTAAAACWFNEPLLMSAAAVLGVASVFCSAMVYIDTRRPFWAAPMTFTRFFGSMLLLGASAGAAVTAWLPGAGGQAGPALLLGTTAMFVRTALFVFDRATHVSALKRPGHPRHRAALTLARLKGGTLRWRQGLFAFSTLSGVLALGNAAGMMPVWALLSFLSTFTSQVLERHLFFTGCPAPRMPGVPASHPIHS